MYLHKFYIGLNDKDTKRQEYTTEEARKFLFQKFNEEFRNFTVSKVTGVYSDIQEVTIVVEILTISKSIEYFKPTLNLIKLKLNQECILHSVQQADVNFI